MQQARLEIEGDFCVFADPALGCQCTFEVVSVEAVEQVTPPPVTEPESSERKAGCGASFLLFALPAFATWLAL